jgi:hypothetical protein
MRKLDRLLLREWVSLGSIIGFLVTLVLISWFNDKRAENIVALSMQNRTQLHKPAVKRKIKKTPDLQEERHNLEEEGLGP